ncbi:Uncharacterized conserved protein, DUF1330 family [Sulfitobacter marinus]|uniref:Uncharacterized conserved protein, DUF1330 family n=1 Tax=Sulfitobacter marinus TaxID=394264 RepID=A0A1I6RNV3_9RHOB|nr:DUF1330 domain-containing protein [Sulfitobacter marinus]SFS66389.1 Uncharacterized conserved protein, DUF1330 family [Sulfitobacter marinus]
MTDYIDPDRAQFDAFKGLDRDTPLNMLNLVRLCKYADYPSDHALAAKNLTGAEAYKNYGAASGPVLADVGGSIIWRGQFEATLIGPSDEAWDIMFIAHYPNAHAFLQMISDPRYKQAVVHRQAAVVTSRLIRSGPLPITDEFA